MLFGCFFNSHFVFVSGKHISFLNACAFGFAVIRECAKFMQTTKDFMNKNASAEDAHDAYLKLYDKVYQFDKHIARRYDGMSGGRYYITVCYLYYDGVLTDEDIREFDDELYNSLKEAKKSFQN